jgi:hypothetical protein
MTCHSTPTAVILDEHARLKNVLHNLHQALCAQAMDRAGVAGLVDDLVQQVLEHFQHEEQGGYFAEAIEAAPRLNDRANMLLGEHAEMARQLVTLQRRVTTEAAGPRWWRRLDEGYSAFVKQFLIHEAAENALLQEAYCEDIGTDG